MYTIELFVKIGEERAGSTMYKTSLSKLPVVRFYLFFSSIHFDMYFVLKCV